MRPTRDIDERFKEIRANVLEIIGFSKDAEHMLDCTKFYPYPYWRMVICFVLRTDGYKITDIARCVNRTHGTVTRSVQIVEDALERKMKCDEDICSMYRSLASRMNLNGNETDEEVIIAPAGKIRTILIESGVKYGNMEKIIEQLKQI